VCPPKKVEKKSPMNPTEQSFETELLVGVGVEGCSFVVVAKLDALAVDDMGASNMNGSLRSRLAGAGSGGADHLYEPSSYVIEDEVEVSEVDAGDIEVIEEGPGEKVLAELATASAENGASCPGPKASMLQLAAFSRYRTSLEEITICPLIQMLKPPSFCPGVLSQMSCRIVVHSPRGNFQAPRPILRPQSLLQMDLGGVLQRAGVCLSLGTYYRQRRQTGVVTHQVELALAILSPHHASAKTARSQHCKSGWHLLGRCISARTPFMTAIQTRKFASFDKVKIGGEVYRILQGGVVRDR
jgi:hypothetical protein